jgi:pantothenate synthetase
MNVTVEMVTRAARAWEEDFDSYPPELQSDALRDARRALEAALSPTETSEP